MATTHQLKSRTQRTKTHWLALTAAALLSCVDLRSAADDHWAFQPPTRPAVPMIEIQNRSIRMPVWAKSIHTDARLGKIQNPIDAFLLAELQKKGLAFSPEADRRTLIRRITYDLIGLQPTPQETDEFLSDRRPDAYERLVDRLLADPRYGERWARHWLDVAGYADSEGILQEDLIRPNAWRYRDYVIRSFNNDKPYDQFIREQIAGDEISNYRNAVKWTPEIEEQVTATGFLRTAVDATRDDFNPHQFAEYQYRMLYDTQTIVSTAILGVTLQCARCHDHKLEPFTQRDYYRVLACFTPAIRPDGPLLPSKRRQIVAATQEEQKHAKEVNAKVDSAIVSIQLKEAALLKEFRSKALEKRLNEIPLADRETLKRAAAQEEAKRTTEQKALVVKYKSLLDIPPDKLAAEFPEFKKSQSLLDAERASQEKQRLILSEIRALYDQDDKPPATSVLTRGEWSRPGDTVQPGFPAVLVKSRNVDAMPMVAANGQTTGRRTALANWLTSPDNPLTARTIVNRVWSQHFGVGIVPTLDNFGRSGAKPTNRALLDWLAVELMSPSAWSLKHLHRLILTSAAYKQSSAFRPDAAKIDPDDKLLWRQRSRRLEAEAIRDAVLSVAGTLDLKMYGEPIIEETRPTGEIVPVDEEKGGRRSIYLLVRRSMPVTFLNSFDAPVVETNCTRRTVSTTATQALAVMNSGFLSSQARHFADRIVKERPPAGNSGRNLEAMSVVYTFELGLNRSPSQTELRDALEFLYRQRAAYMKTAKSIKEAEHSALADFCQALLGANEFVYVD